MIAVDTRVWIDCLKLAQTAQAMRLGAELRSGRDIAITDMVYVELLQGVPDEAAAARLLCCTTTSTSIGSLTCPT